MAGADHNGEDIQTGRTNRAESRTKIWAQREEDADFDGEAILVVEAAGDIDDDDYRQVDDSLVAHGILASGIGAGAGMVGFNRRHPVFAPGLELSPADLANSSNVGVFGKGTTGVVAQGDFRGAPDQAIVDGRGVGIIGRGDRNLVSAPGVVGFSGGVSDEAIPANTGVVGKGPTGVAGLGTRGPGVKGVGSTDEPGVVGEGQDGVQGRGLEGRGGIFESRRSAQVQLVPARGRVVPEQESFTPTIVPEPGRLGPELPRAGRAGDLMSVIDERGVCTLWFCTEGENGAAAARWAQVLLGPTFDGQA